MLKTLETTSFFNKETRISILIPKGWTTDRVNSLKFRIFGWSESGFEQYFDEYKPTMSYELIRPQNFSSDKFLEDLVTENNEEMRKTYHKYEVMDEAYGKVAHAQSYIKHYQWQEETTGLMLTQMQAFMLASRFSLYVINSAVLSKLNEKYTPIFDFILNSTRVIPSA